MNTVYLDCSGLPNSIRINTGDLPNSIYIDGQEFVRRLQILLDELHNPPEKTDKEKRWGLILALAGNANICSYPFSSNQTSKKTSMSETAELIIEQANEIIKQMGIK